MSWHQDIMEGKTSQESNWAFFAWLSAGFVFFCVIGLLYSYYFLLWPLNAIGMTISFFLGCIILYFFVWQNFVRYLADNGWFFLRVPEMRAAFIEKDRGLYRIYVNVSGERKEHFEKLAKYKNSKAGYKRMEVLNPQRQIVWIGLPWIYRLKSPWWEKTKDMDDGDKSPVRFLDLRERTIDLPREKDPGAVIPNVDTADPIQVEARIILSLRVFDPEKVLYGVQFFMEAVQNEVAGRWRQAVSGLYYFMGKEPDPKDTAKWVKELEINPQIQKEIHRQLNYELLKISREVESFNPQGVSMKEEKRFEPELVLTEQQTPSGEVVYIQSYKDCYPEFSPAYDILDDWGIQIMRVEIRDLDPTNEIREALNDKNKAIAQAAAQYERAKGKRAEREELGKGERAYKEEVAKGDQAAERAKRVGVAEGLRAIADSANVESGYAALASDTAVRVAEGTENIITDGGLPGMVAQASKVWKSLESPKGKQAKPQKSTPDKGGTT